MPLSIIQIYISCAPAVYDVMLHWGEWQQTIPEPPVVACPTGPEAATAEVAVKIDTVTGEGGQTVDVCGKVV